MVCIQSFIYSYIFKLCYLYLHVSLFLLIGIAGWYHFGGYLHLFCLHGDWRFSSVASYCFSVRCIWMGDIYCIHLIAESVLISFLIVFDMSPCYVPYIDHSPNKSRWIKMKSSSHFMSLGDTHFAK